MDMGLLNFLLFIGIGCVIGFLAGLFGVGGGVLMVPVLIFTYEYSGYSPSVLTHVAIGTSLFVVLFASLSSAYQHRRQKNIDWRAVFLIGLSSALTAFGTARLAAILRGRSLQVVFAVVVIMAGIRLLTEGEAQARQKLELSSEPSPIRLMIVGITAGIVSALAGIGGGVVTIPMMYYLVRMPLKLAIGTSSAAIFITAAFSVSGYVLNGMGRTGLPGWSLGFVDLQKGAALAVGSLLMARVGAYVSFRTHPYRLRKLFAIFVICVSLYMLLK
jgi:uncharacterized membrane protein YfcA